MAVHVLTLLTRADGAPLKSESIARSVNTNPVVIRRLLGQLAHAGLVVSHSGSQGGTRLAIGADDIRLSQIYKAVCCGEIFALHDSPSQDCPVGRGIESVLCILQKQIDTAVDEKLARYSLREITQMVEEAS